MSKVGSTYFYRTTLVVLNLISSVYLLKALDKGMFELIMVIGIIQYLISSLGYFGEFGTYLRDDNINRSMNSVRSKRLNFSVLPISLIFYYYFLGSVSLSHAFILVIIILFWILSPYELYIRTSMSLLEELRIENIRLSYTLVVRVITVVFLSKTSIVISFLFIQFFPLLYLVKSTNFKLSSIEVSWLYYKGNYGLLYGMASIVFVKFDFFISSIFNITEKVYLGHKIEELGLLVLSLFLPFSQREILVNKSKSTLLILTIFFILVSLSYLLIDKFLITYLSFLDGIYILKQVILNPFVVFSFTATTILYFYNDLLFYKYLTLGSVKDLLQPFIIVVLFTILLEFIIMNFYGDYYQIVRIAGAVLFFILIFSKLKRFQITN